MNPSNVASLPQNRTPVPAISFTDITHIEVMASADRIELIKHDDCKYAIAIAGQVFVYVDHVGAQKLERLLGEVNRA